MRKLEEALTPRQAAISLTGEPTLYEHLGELIRTFHKRNFTTFLMSNGTVPSALAKLAKNPHNSTFPLVGLTKKRSNDSAAHRQQKRGRN
jgi:tRNA wybutosine-synthesizing protein 1